MPRTLRHCNSVTSNLPPTSPFVRLCLCFLLFTSFVALCPTDKWDGLTLVLLILWFILFNMMFPVPAKITLYDSIFFFIAVQYLIMSVDQIFDDAYRPQHLYSFILYGHLGHLHIVSIVLQWIQVFLLLVIVKLYISAPPKSSYCFP